MLARVGPVFAGLTGALILLMMVVTTVDVTLRYFFNAPLKGAFEMTEIGMALVIFGGMSLATARREHITVNLIEGRLPPVLRRWQRVFADIVCAAAVAVLAWRIAVRADALLASGETTLVLGVPRGYIAYAMAALSVLAVGVFLHAAWRAANEPLPDDDTGAPQGTAL